MIDHAVQTLVLIKEAIDKGEEQIEKGELLESDVIESVYALVEEYFKLVNM